MGLIDLDGKRVALALGGGGARGAAHIGVIEELEQRGARIVAVAGTSMGAVIGGVHAVGRLAEYGSWLASLTQRDVLRLLDPSLRSPGMIGAEKVMAKIREVIGDIRIEQLPIPYTAVATDLIAGKELWFQEGPLDVAMRASIAIPSVITPLVHEGRVLADGGMLNLVPVTPLAGVRADVIVAVSVGGAPQGAPVFPTRSPADAELEQVRTAATHARDLDMLSRIRARLGWERSEASEAADRARVQAEKAINVRTLDIMELSLQAMQRMITRYQLASYPADIFIEMPVDMCGTMEFHRSRTMIEVGRDYARAAFDGYAAPRHAFISEQSDPHSLAPQI